MKGRIKLLIADGQPGEKSPGIKAEGIEIPDHEVPIFLETDEDLSGLVGKAKLSLEKNVLYATVDILDTRIPKETPPLYPCAVLVVTERGGNVVTRCVVKHIALSISKNVDSRIKPLTEQGTK